MRSNALSISFIFNLVFTFAFTLISITSQRDAYADDQTVNTPKVQAFLKVNPKWRHHQGSISRIFTFKSGFKGAIEFVRRLVEPADRLNHHPDLKITYNRVTVTLTTHDAGGLTKADLKLATIITKIFEQITHGHKR